MQKIPSAFIIFSILLMIMPFAMQAQDKAIVTVTIKKLTAISTDACNEKMDFYAKINIGGKVKSFPVMEGNNLQPNWQFETTTDKDIVTPFIEIWDDDDALCGGGDDEVSISGSSNKVRKSLSTAENQSVDYTSFGSINKNGNEKATISYTITIVPIKTKNQLLTQRNWEKIKVERATKSATGLIGVYMPSLQPPTYIACKKDDEYVFSFKGHYEKNEGATKCAASAPQIIATGNWIFKNNETEIQVTTTESATPLLYKVSKLNENTLWLVIEETSEGITTYTRIIYGH